VTGGENYGTQKDKRRNIPTEELRDFDRRQTAIQQRAKLTPCSKEE
jgi:hypothetical protein